MRPEGGCVCATAKPSERSEFHMQVPGDCIPTDPGL